MWIYQNMLVGRNYDKKVVEYEVPLSAPVQVPADFAGMHFHRWPINNRPETTPDTPAPDHLMYTSRRTHDAGTSWYDINNASGVFDWSTLDSVVDDNISRGATTWYTIYGTPAWAVLDTADASYNDLYGRPGGAAPCRHDALGVFLTELLQRYNSGEAKIKYIELWNEPHFNESYSGFYWGTEVELIEMCYFASNLIKSIDPRVIIVSPGFNHMIHLESFATTYSSTINKHGWEVCDAWAYHPYHAEPWPGLYWIVSGGYNTSIGTMQRILKDAGSTTHSIYMSECGINGVVQALTDNVGVFKRFYEEHGSAWRRTFISRIMALAAIHGVKAWYWYSYDGFPSKDLADTRTISGDWIADIDGVVAGFNDIVTVLCGKTITRAWISSTGQVRAIVDGQEVVF